MRLLLLPLLAFAAVGCTNVAGTVAKGDASVRQVLAQVCPAADVVYNEYAQIASAVPANIQGYVNRAKASWDSMCDGRETATMVSVYFKSRALYDAFDQARKSAQSRGAAVGYAGNIQKLDGMLAKAKIQLNRYQPR